MNKRRKLAHSVFFTPLLLITALSEADYLVTGQVEGSTCTGIGIKSCSFVSVDAVEGDDGRLYTVKDRYGTVDDYSPAKERCWIETQSREGGLMGWFVDTLSTHQFYTRGEDGFEKVDVEYITFPCEEL